VSQEGESFDVALSVAKMSELVKTMIDEDQDEDEAQDIPLPNVKSSILAKVIEFEQHSAIEKMNEIEKVADVVDAVVLLEIAYPLRRVNDISDMLDRLYAEGLEVVVASRRERRGLWADDNGVVVQVGEGFKPRETKTSSAYIGLLGYGTILRSAALRGQEPFASRVGVFEVPDEISSLEFRSSLDLPLARRLLDRANSESS